MDALDQLTDAAAALLDRVDTILSQAGAPADHPVWRALRAVGVLPAAAVAAVTALAPEAVDADTARLRELARSADQVRIALPAPGEWAGEAADAYDTARRRLSADISHELVDDLEATAAHGAAVADWMRETRRDLARTLAEVLGSVETVAVLTPDAVDGSATELPVRAAADIAAFVLDAVAAAYESADELLAPVRR